VVEAMLLGGLRRCEVLGLRLPDVRPGERRLFIAEGKNGHQRIVPVSARFFNTLADYLHQQRPTDAVDDHLFVVLKGPQRGQTLSAAGLDEIVRGARRRAGIAQLTCHQLRHTCLTRLREAGMALEALRPRPGTAPSSRPGSICTWPTTGSSPSTAGPPRRSTPRPSRRLPPRRWTDAGRRPPGRGG
jgi:integrase/recombinase XerD